MRIKNIGPKISGVPLPGEVGEVDDDFARTLIARGYAEDMSSLAARLADFKSEHESPGTGVEMVEVEALLGVPTTLTDGDKQVTATIEVKPASKKKANETPVTLEVDAIDDDELERLTAPD